MNKKEEFGTTAKGSIIRNEKPEFEKLALCQL